MMKIEVWSDYVCPFCYIGKRELENALNKTGFKDQVEVVFKGYQLSPESKDTSDESMYEVVAKKYGTTVEQAKIQSQSIIARAKELGLDYDYDHLKPANTFKAHRLAKYAATKGLGAEMSERLLRAYFIEAKEIGLTDTLVELAAEVGIERKDAEEILANGSFADDVLRDIQEAAQIGVRGVPFFVLNGKYAISGAQPNEVFEKAIQQVAEEENLRPTLKMMGQDGQGICTDDHCDF